MGDPQNGSKWIVYSGKSCLKMDDMGVPLFQATPICIYIYMYTCVYVCVCAYLSFCLFMYLILRLPKMGVLPNPPFVV